MRSLVVCDFGFQNYFQFFAASNHDLAPQFQAYTLSFILLILPDRLFHRFSTFSLFHNLISVQE